jgi:chromosome partitioning protein
MDLDPQANSSMTYVDIRALEVDVMSDEWRSRSNIVASPVPNLELARHDRAGKLESKLGGDRRSLSSKDRLATINGRFTSSSSTHRLRSVSLRSMLSCGRIPVPVRPVTSRSRGRPAGDRREDPGRPNPDLKLLGAVITLHDKRTTLARDVQKAISEVFGNRVFRTTVTKSIRLEESPAHKESIFTFAPQSTGAYEYYKLCEEVIERV